MGCKILFLSPFEHDTIISGTSHIPHLIACALVDFIGKKIQKDKSVLDLIGSGFKGYYSYSLWEIHRCGVRYSYPIEKIECGYSGFL